MKIVCFFFRCTVVTLYYYCIHYTCTYYIGIRVCVLHIIIQCVQWWVYFASVDGGGGGWESRASAPRNGFTTCRTPPLHPRRTNTTGPTRARTCYAALSLTCSWLRFKSSDCVKHPRNLPFNGSPTRNVFFTIIIFNRFLGDVFNVSIPTSNMLYIFFFFLLPVARGVLLLSQCSVPAYLYTNLRKSATIIIFHFLKIWSFIVRI